MEPRPTLDDRRLIQIDLETLFVLSSEGRIESENDPPRSPGPRIALFASSAGLRLALESGIRMREAEDLRAAVREAPDWTDPARAPACLARLSEAIAVPKVRETHLIHHLPHGLSASPGSANLVRSGEPHGEALLARLAQEGVSPALAKAGFTDAGEFWPPWCAALLESEIAALAFAARLSRRGAEIGIYTLESHRRRGHASALTAAWSRHPMLAGRELFYSCALSNSASRAVARHLGLRLIGWSLAIF
ncbi:MAG: GNAT family N-acetyltransferase [Caulobacteraceae bacterium]